jgi:hypothetical protein
MVKAVKASKTLVEVTSGTKTRMYCAGEGTTELAEMKATLLLWGGG